MTTLKIGLRVRDRRGRRGTVVDVRQGGREARIAWDWYEPTWESVSDLQTIGRESISAAAR